MITRGISFAKVVLLLRYRPFRRVDRPCALYTTIPSGPHTRVWSRPFVYVHSNSSRTVVVNPVTRSAVVALYRDRCRWRLFIYIIWDRRPLRRARTSRKIRENTRTQCVCVCMGLKHKLFRRVIACPHIIYIHKYVQREEFWLLWGNASKNVTTTGRSWWSSYGTTMCRSLLLLSPLTRAYEAVFSAGGRPAILDGSILSSVDEPRPRNIMTFVSGRRFRWKNWARGIALKEGLLFLRFVLWS